MDPIKAFEIIEGELAAFSDSLIAKPMIVAATKLDATTDKSKLDELRAFCAEKDLEFHAISAPTGEGVKELVRGIADALDKIPKESPDIEEDTDDVEDGDEPELVEDLAESGEEIPGEQDEEIEDRS